MKKVFLLFLASIFFVCLALCSEISDLAESYSKTAASGEAKDYALYLKQENNFLRGLPGKSKYSTKDEYRTAWKECVSDFEDYWSANCPMQNYTEYPAKLQTSAVSRPGATSTFYIIVDWRPSPVFEQCRTALSRGYLNAYNITGLPGLPQKWPLVSSHSSAFDFSAKQYLSGVVPLVRTSSGTICMASAYTGPANSMYQAAFNLVDKNGKVYYTGVWEQIGPSSKYEFPDVSQETANLIKKGLVFAKPSGLRLTYGDMNTFDFKEIILNVEKSGLAGLSKKNKFNQAKENFFCQNKDLVSAILNGDSSGVKKLLDEYFVLVPQGKFTMGEGGVQKETGPEHTVSLDSFYLQITEVPQWLYQAVMGENPSENRGDGLPVECLSWHKAVLFCNALSILAGLEPCYKNVSQSSLGGTGAVVCNFNANGYRLPTEAEWEYAAKGGGLSYKAYEYSGTDSIPLDYSVNVNAQKNVAYSGPARCASLLPNDLGLYDMSGNVWEWCNDIYGHYKDGNFVNPTGASAGDGYVLRGGSWGSPLNECRLVFRRKENGSSVVFAEYSSNYADKEKKSIGLRLCRHR